VGEGRRGKESLCHIGKLHFLLGEGSEEGSEPPRITRGGGETSSKLNVSREKDCSCEEKKK